MSQNKELSFDHFGLSDELLKCIKDAGFVTPSPIQMEAIPLVLQGKDMIAQAQTGTGKTAAFGLPAMELIDKEQSGALLVITPTRELAAQVSEELFKLGNRLGIKTVTICGGKSSSRQIDLLKRGSSVVVATPGRLLDLLESKQLGKFSPSIIVLDEADEMLNMGFIDDIKKIFTFLPKERQTLLFSATMPPPIQKLAKEILKNPVLVSVTPKETTTNVDIEQTYYLIDESQRMPALIRLLQTLDEKAKSVIFCKTRKDVDDVSTYLNSSGLRARGLHGEMEQNAREEVMKSFRAGRTQFLVATDVAARGINVIDVTHVINYHLPFDAESYVHRIGRTGRAGRQGIAISLVLPREMRHLSFFEKRIGAKVTKKKIPTLQDLKRVKIEKLVNETKEAIVKDEAYQILRELEKVMAHSEIAEKLLSMLYDEGAINGPEEIGASDERGERKPSNKKRFDQKVHRRDFRSRRGAPSKGKRERKPSRASSY